MTTVRQRPGTTTPPMTATVVAVIQRAAGHVTTAVTVHPIDRDQREAHIRIGDAVLWVRDAPVIQRIRQQWDASQYLSNRLRGAVSATWLQPDPDAYPISVAQRLGEATDVAVQWLGGKLHTRTPPHLRIRVGTLVWQVCDRTAWTTISQAWWQAEKLLTGPGGPTRLP
jgi:hypothetical protein